MITLAWLSQDERVRAVAGRWTALPATARRHTELEVLCGAAGATVDDFLKDVADTGFELGMIDLAGMFGAMFAATDNSESALASLIERAKLPKGSAAREQLWRFGRLPPPAHHEQCCTLRIGTFRGPSKRDSHGSRVRSAEAHHACSQMARMRERWRLSQRQFARLFVTSVRTVRRWEGYKYAPTLHQQWFLGLFVQWAEQHGIRKFRRRFVRGTPRYGKPGRPRARRV